MTNKDNLRAKFSAEPEKYYNVDLFKREGFLRKKCDSCGRYFWTLLPERNHCPEYPCSQYEFLGDPPTNQRVSYSEAWKLIETFFKNQGHSSIKRYPVVCRWRPDLYFTVASVIDFQRIEGGKVVFELPSNPLVIPQICLRFNDINNVGVSGRHYTSFCMIGQHSIDDGQGYWKDRCIDLDYNLVTKIFGIHKEELVFLEDAWIGYGAFGSSLEYFVRGLELGNAVFTEFEGTPENSIPIKKRVIDMGAGLERFAWLTNGTLSSYDTTFSYALTQLIDQTHIDYDQDFLLKYAKVAGGLDFDSKDTRYLKSSLADKIGISQEKLIQKVEPLESLYALLDHSRTLAFAISDGGLPSNIAGGYNLRVVLRRSLDIIKKHNWNLSLSDLVELHINGLSNIYPELSESRDEIFTILKVEEQRYEKNKFRGEKIIEKLVKTNQVLSQEKLVKLYDSDGLTPDFLISRGVKVSETDNFYSQLSTIHSSQNTKSEAKPQFETSGISTTKILFYDQNLNLNFNAKVLKILDDQYIILDQTSFYPRSGGQEPDWGTISSMNVLDVIKYGDIILHKIDGLKTKEGETVECKIDPIRRSSLTRHHTVTHIINGAARKLLGSWVWQHSAFKDVNKARLDISHYEHLTKKQLLDIETLANEVIQANLQVKKEILLRGDAEKQYGFRIYQGGVVPVNTVRIINIDGWDVEACGGMHCNRTGEVGYVKILRSERIQDGVERIEFVAGIPAVSYSQQTEDSLLSISQTLGVQQEKASTAVANLKSQFDSLQSKLRSLTRKLVLTEINSVQNNAEHINDFLLLLNDDESADEKYHINFGEMSIEKTSNLIYIGLIAKEQNVKVLVFVGKSANSKGVNAGILAATISKYLGGSGGGDNRFGQGGGSNVSTEKRKRSTILELIKAQLRV